jgi:hypothetical protein
MHNRVSAGISWAILAVYDSRHMISSSLLSVGQSGGSKTRGYRKIDLCHGCPENSWAERHRGSPGVMWPPYFVEAPLHQGLWCRLDVGVVVQYLDTDCPNRLWVPLRPRRRKNSRRKPNPKRYVTGMYESDICCYYSVYVRRSQRRNWE